jgi:hypothetical protein
MKGIESHIQLLQRINGPSERAGCDGATPEFDQ